MAKSKQKKIKWACPSCGATASKHGKGGKSACIAGNQLGCDGFLCECDDVCGSAKGHGESHDNPCVNAVCYHCGWAGVFPVPLFDPKKLKGWAKKAYEAGWKPPSDWTTED